MSSEPSTPSSISSNEEVITRTMGDVIKNYDTEELIDYLRRKDLKLKESHFEILREQEIAGLDFLKFTEKRFRDLGIPIGPAIRLVEFIEEIKKQKLRGFSTYKTIEELKVVLTKYKVNGEDITNIKQFNPVFEEIDDSDELFNHCMEHIILVLNNIETMTDANEATRCEFISCILHTSIAIVRRLTGKEEIYLALQKDVSGEESSGRVDYAIKTLETLVCILEGKPRNVKIGYLQNIKQLEEAYHMNKKKRSADQAFDEDDYDYLYGIVSTATEWHFLLFTTHGIYCTSGMEYNINLSKSAAKEEKESLRKSVKRVVGIIVGLLRDRVTAQNSSSSKRARIEKFIKK